MLEMKEFESSKWLI